MQKISLLAVTFLLCIPVTLTYVDQQVDFVKLCKGDVYCAKFCPYLRAVYMTSLTIVAPCALGVARIVHCEEERHVCTDWCSHLHNQLHETVRKPAEWNPCMSGVRPPGCEKDPDCVKWCDMVKYGFQNTTAQIQSCLKTGEPLSSCDDKKLCEDICSTSMNAMLSPNVPMVVTNCIFMGHP